MRQAPLQLSDLLVIESTYLDCLSHLKKAQAHILKTTVMTEVDIPIEVAVQSISIQLETTQVLIKKKRDEQPRDTA